MITFGLLALLLLAFAAGALVLFLPADRFRDPIVAAVKDATGLTLTIAGPMNFTFAPEPALALAEVTLASDDPAGPPVVHAESITLAVNLLPLFTGDLKVGRILLDGCTIIIERSKDGAIWSLSGDLRALGDVTLASCKVMYRDEQRGRALELATDGLRLRWPEDGTSLSIAGGIVLRGEQLEIDGSLRNPAGLFEGGRMPFQAQLSGRLIEGMVDGHADLGALRFEGGVNISAPSARRLAALFGVALPGDRGLGQLSLAASTSIGPGEAHFRDAKFTLDGMTGGGALGLKIVGDLPSIAGALNIDRIDLATYLSFQEPETEEEDGEGWSIAAADLSALGQFTLDVALKAHRASLLNLTFTEADLLLNAGRSAAGISLRRGVLAGGSAVGEIRVTLGDGAPFFAVTGTLRDADAAMLLPDLLGIENVSGRLALRLALSGTGVSQRDLVHHLAGNAEFTLRNGAIDGIDLGAIAAGITEPQGYDGIGEDQATNFAMLGGRFDVADGVARTDNLALAGPFLHLEGRGALGLPARLIQLTLSARFVAEAGGQADRTPGVAMPFVATGPFELALYLPDPAELSDRIARGEVLPEELLPLPQPVRDWILAAGGVAGPPPLPGAGRLVP